MHRLAERLWILLSIGYAFVRILLADRFLAKYGLSIVWFAIIEIVSSVVFALSSTRFIRAMNTATSGRRPLWAVGTLLGFSLPDAFVFATTRQVPGKLLVILVLIAATTLTMSAISLVRRLRAARTY